MSRFSSDEEFNPPENLITLSVSSTGTPSFTTPRHLKRKKSWLSRIRGRPERVGMSTPAQASSSNAPIPQEEGTGGTGTQPSSNPGRNQGIEVIGAPAIPPQVLAVCAEGDLPAWFRPLWEHLSNLHLERSNAVQAVATDVQVLQRKVDRISEFAMRLKGVEEGMSAVEVKSNEIISNSQVVGNHLQEVEKRLDTLTERCDKMSKDLGRALEARPTTQGGGNQAPQLKEEVPAASDQPQSFWPGSVAPPQGLPKMVPGFFGASAGPSASAHEQEKNDGEAQWSSMSLPRRNVLGPAVPMLTPFQTILNPFSTVVDYRYYRLRDTTTFATGEDVKNLYKLKDKTENYHRSLKPYDGSDPLALFEFLSIFKKAMNDLGKSEAVAVRVFSYFVTDEAEDQYDSQMTADLALSDGQATDTWPHVVNRLIHTFITDDVLQDAYNDVIRAQQRPEEHVSDFIMRLQDLAKRCHGVFPQTEMANMVMRGMKPAIRHRIQNTVNSLSAHERSNVTKIRQLAVQEDNAQRTQAAELTSSSAKAAKSKKPTGRVSKALHIGVSEGAPQYSPPTTPSTRHKTQDPSDLPETRAHDPQAMVLSVVDLDAIMQITDTAIEKALERNGLDPTSIMQTMKDMPELTEDQFDHALTVIPADYWRLSCWTCREHGHVTYTCQYLSPKQRIFAAYCYYRHQVYSNPSLKDWYDKKLEYMRGKGPAPGPQPGSDPFFGGMRGRGGGRGRGYGRGYDQGYRQPQWQKPAKPVAAQDQGQVRVVSKPAAPVNVVQESSNSTSDSSSNSGKE